MKISDKCASGHQRFTDDLTKVLREVHGYGMTNGDETILEIKHIGGFEIFGHYECWGFGWEVENKRTGKKSSNECLPCAIKNTLQPPPLTS